MNRPASRVPDARQAELFAVELRTSDWERLVGWYGEVAGLPVLVRIPEDRYALLGGTGGRLAILGRGEPASASPRWSLAIEVADLSAARVRLEAAGSPAPPASLHPEGYWQIATTDLDGNRVVLFAWPDGRA